MSIKDQALKKLETGLTLCWHSNPMLRARATEIIESLALQLEAKGDHAEEYRKGFKDGVQSKEFVNRLQDIPEPEIDIIESCDNCENQKFGFIGNSICGVCGDFENFKPKGE